MTVARRLFSILLVAGWAVPAQAALFTLETRQRSSVAICTDGVPGPCLLSGADSTVNSISHSNIIDGTLLTPSQARTSGRAGSLEIAANASLEHRSGRPFVNYTHVFGSSSYDADFVALTPGNVTLAFNLPPGFVEIESNVELRDVVQLTATITADLRFCSPACGIALTIPPLFQLSAELEGGFDTHTFANSAVSVNPALDTSPLEHTTVDIVDAGSIRKKTWEYGAFTGEIPLGHFAAGQTFTVSYGLTAHTFANMPGFQTWAAAAINDPFFLSTDPLPQASLFTFDFVEDAVPPPVPEPGTLALIGVGLGAIALLRRRSVVRGRVG